MSDETTIETDVVSHVYRNRIIIFSLMIRKVKDFAGWWEAYPLQEPTNHITQRASLDETMRDADYYLEGYRRGYDDGFDAGQRATNKRRSSGSSPVESVRGSGAHGERTGEGDGQD